MDVVAKVVVPAAAALIMFCLGLGLTWQDLLTMLRQRRAVAVGLILQLLLMPLLAALLARTMAMDPVLAMGLGLIAASPVSTPANLLTRLAGGSVALSVSLTALTSLLSAITIPLSFHLVQFSIPGEQTLWTISIWRMAVGLFVIVSLPAIAGMFVRQRAPAWAVRAEKIAIRGAVFAFIIGLALAIIGVAPQIPVSLARAGPGALVLCVIGMIMAHVGCVAMRLDAATRCAIVLGVGTRKFTSAAIVSLAFLGDVRVLMPAIAYGLLMWIPAGIVVGLARRRVVLPVGRLPQSPAADV